MAPTGLMRSWQTREHSIAARSAASSSIVLVMAGFAFRIQIESIWQHFTVQVRRSNAKARPARGCAQLLWRGDAPVGQWIPMPEGVGEGGGRCKVEGRPVSDGIE